MSCASIHFGSATAAYERFAAVRAVDLGKEIDGRHILCDLNFEIRSGEFIALLGANGAGKSTLLKILATLVAPSRGELLLFGKPCGMDASLRSRLGMIGHGAMLYRDLSAQENLVFFGKLYGVQNPVKRAMELLDWIGLSHRAHDAVKTFSRGMTQRVAIARALMHEPDLLLADEPFAGLDAPSADMLQNMLRHLHAAGCTVILANHDISQTLELAKRVLVLRDGRIAVDSAAKQHDARSLLQEVAGT